MPESTPDQHETRLTAPKAQGLYDPANEHDNCGVGFIANVKGQRSHAIVEQALTMLSRMDHRGGCGCESNTGDGAGILTAIPNKLMQKVAKADLGIDLPELGEYAVGNIFLPTEAVQQKLAKETYEQKLAELDLKVLGWRTPPMDPVGADVGPTALKSMPTIQQLFVGCTPGMDNDDFERKLYLARNRVINAVQHPEASLKRAAFTSARSPRERLFTRASSHRARSPRSTTTCVTPTTPRTWRWSTRALARTPSRVGTALSLAE